MKAFLIASLLLTWLAAPAIAHPHGAKSKRYHGHTYKKHRSNGYVTRYRRQRSRDYAPCFRASGTPQFYPQYPLWAACAFEGNAVRR